MTSPKPYANDQGPYINGVGMRRVYRVKTHCANHTSQSPKGTEGIRQELKASELTKVRGEPRISV